jgi:uncharacterized protein (TIGR03435 family)
MRELVVCAGALLLACGAALGQAPTADASVTFDVAAVRPARSSGGEQSVSGGPGTANPGRIMYTDCSLQTLLLIAYGVPPNQVSRNQLDRLSGPAWLRTEVFDIVANVPTGATQDQVPLMLRNLLIERFKLVLHHQSKEAEGYALTVAKNGPAAKLKEPAAAPKSDLDKDGFPKLAPGVRSAYSLKADRSGARVVARQLTMAEVAKLFRTPAGGVDVVDKTGLTGSYDFTLYFSPGGTIDDPSGTFKATVERELGLKLEKAKIPVDVLVVDHIEKVPTEN